MRISVELRAFLTATLTRIHVPDLLAASLDWDDLLSYSSAVIVVRVQNGIAQADTPAILVILIAPRMVNGVNATQQRREHAMVPDDLIRRAEDGQIEALAELDQYGLIAGAGETLPDYIARLRHLQGRIAEMTQALDEQGEFHIEGITLGRDEQIPAELFEEVRPIVEPKYQFMCDWVPGFYIDPSFGWLFGGCAFYFYPDFFALFIIRKSFMTKKKWLIYDRRELLAHELCHVARAGIHSRIFEEHLAYQTSSNGFRRHVGGVFHTPLDSYLLLGSTLLLLLMQVLKTLFLPTLPIWPFWFGVGLVAGYLAVRSMHYRNLLSRASDTLGATTAKPEAILFRCTDAEICTIARELTAETAGDWITRKAENDLRWQVIHHRFMA